MRGLKKIGRVERDCVVQAQGYTSTIIPMGAGVGVSWRPGGRQNGAVKLWNGSVIVCSCGRWLIYWQAVAAADLHMAITRT